MTDHLSVVILNFERAMMNTSTLAIFAEKEGVVVHVGLAEIKVEESCDVNIVWCVQDAVEQLSCVQ